MLLLYIKNKKHSSFTNGNCENNAGERKINNLASSPKNEKKDY